MDVKADPTKLEEMLEFTKGKRSVPVMVKDGEDVTIGFGGS